MAAADPGSAFSPIEISVPLSHPPRTASSAAFASIRSAHFSRTLRRAAAQLAADTATIAEIEALLEN